MKIPVVIAIGFSVFALGSMPVGAQSTPVSTTALGPSTSTAPPTTTAPRAPTTTTDPVLADGSIGGSVWLDTNSDNKMDPNEPGIPGVTTELRRLEDAATGTWTTVATTPTGARGEYRFDRLSPGTYRIVLVAGLPAGLTTTFDPDRGVERESVVGLSNAHPSNLDQNFGFVGAGQICATVTGDSKQPLDGANVTVLGPNNMVITTTTDAEGRFCVSGLPVGDFKIVATKDGFNDATKALSLTNTKPGVEILGLRLERVRSLAFTGAEIASTVTAAIGMIVIGAMLTIRRRRSV